MPPDFSKSLRAGFVALLDDELWAAASFLEDDCLLAAFEVAPAVSVTFANSLSRASVKDNLCGYSYAGTTAAGAVTPLAPEALASMFEHDRSAARGEMATRGLYVFEHESRLGSAPAHDLFDRITPRLKDGVAAPRSFTDYVVDVNEAGLSGVKLLRLVG